MRGQSFVLSILYLPLNKPSYNIFFLTLTSLGLLQKSAFVILLTFQLALLNAD